MRFKLILVILLGITFSGVAQSVNWYTSVSGKVEANKIFEIEFVLENAKGKDFNPPAFDGIRVVSGPSFSSSTQIINGSSSSKLSYVYSAVVEEKGKYTIGSASISVEGKQVRTSPYSFSASSGDAPVTVDSDFSGENYFVRMEVSDTTICLGQQVSINYVLYYNTSLKSGGDFISEHDYSGLFARAIAGSSRASTKLVNSNSFKSRLLKTIVIFPQEKGITEISPFELKVSIPTGKRRMGFVVMQDYDHKILKSNGISFKVVDLPKISDGFVSEGFCGAVGNRFNVSTQLNRTSTTTDDAIALHLTVRGDGDVRKVNAPKLRTTDDWEIYEPTLVDEREFAKDESIEFIKSFEYLLLPNKTGMLKIEPLFTYFDTDSNAYIQQVVKPLYIDVKQGKREVLNRNSNLYSEKEIVGLKSESVSFTGLDENPFLSSWYLGSVLVLLSGFGGLFWYKQKIEAFDQLGVADKKQQRALKLAKMKLKNASLFLEQNELKPFYSELSSALNGYIADKYKISFAEISKSKVLEVLAQNVGDHDIVSNYSDLLNSCEMALFAGQSLVNSDETYKKALDLIVRIEQAQKTK